MIEGARRQKTPNEIALNIVLVSLTALFILVVFTLPPFAHYNEAQAGQNERRCSLPLPVLLAAHRLPDSHHHRRACSAPSASPALTA